jgi:branched-chain amino acid transport system permease protein
MSTPRANIEVLPRSAQLTLVLGLVALLAFPFVGSDFYVQMVTRMMIMAIFAMSLDLLQGVTGLVSLGHAAYFGVAGYALAFLTPADTPVSLWWTLPLAVAGAGLVALVIGFFVVRTHGIYFIMVTMAFAQMVFYLFFDNKVLGGSDGLYINFRPDASILGWLPFDLEGRKTFYYFTLALVVIVYALLRRLLWSPLGRALSGIRINEHRMRRHGLWHARLQAHGLHGGGSAGGPGRLPVGRTDRLCEPRADGLSHERARDHDGHPGGHGQFCGRDCGRLCV